MSRCVIHIGDVFHHMAAIPDHSVDLIVTSPPFLALRSYLPADHPDKHLEIGSEPTPAAFLSTLLALTREWRRILAPYGSLCVELGDTYAGSSGSAVDAPQDDDSGTMKFARIPSDGRPPIRNMDSKVQGGGRGWPLPKSLCGIPTLYAWSLAYGRNLLRAPLTGRELLNFVDNAVNVGKMTAADAIACARLWMDEREDGDPDELDPWRIRNLIVWHRPNPPVGALGDKVRPSTSYVTVGCVSDKRWFDLDAERGAISEWTQSYADRVVPVSTRSSNTQDNNLDTRHEPKPVSQQGAPPLDCWIDGDVWTIPTAPYKGAHYATYPTALPRRLIRLMCPRQVCVVCGEPRRRIVGEAEYVQSRNGGTPAVMDMRDGVQLEAGVVRNWSANGAARGDNGVTRTVPTLGWTDCGHNTFRRGHVLDPFAGSGTTLIAAAEQGRDATGIDLDDRNLELIRERVGLFLEEVG